jgi:hypothetical protein
MPRVRFEPMIPVFEGPEMVHVTVIGVGKLTEENSYANVFEYPIGLRIREVRSN